MEGAICFSKSSLAMLQIHPKGFACTGDVSQGPKESSGLSRKCCLEPACMPAKSPCREAGSDKASLLRAAEVSKSRRGSAAGDGNGDGLPS
jgi:hypothetical protein